MLVFDICCCLGWTGVMMLRLTQWCCGRYDAVVFCVRSRGRLTKARRDTRCSRLLLHQTPFLYPGDLFNPHNIPTPFVRVVGGTAEVTYFPTYSHAVATYTTGATRLSSRREPALMALDLRCLRTANRCIVSCSRALDIFFGGSSLSSRYCTVHF